MSEQSDINQTIKESEYAATSATGNAAIYIYNYYNYREEVGVAPVKADETATDDKLPSPKDSPDSRRQPSLSYLLSLNNAGVVQGCRLESRDIVPPYRGLFHFGPESAEFFFGREVFVAELVQDTRTHNVIAHLLAV